MRTLTRNELVSLMDSGVVFKLVDVLSKESYDNEHIRGAISIPLDEIETKAEKLLERRERIVVYCASFTCTASTKGAEKLTALGFKDVWDYKGGLQDYKEAHLPLEGAAHTQELREECCAGCSCER